MDFDEILTPGDIEAGIVNVVVEIPTGSKNKIEWNRDEEIMQLDRIEYDGEPANYGFIPRTLSGDGDELDVIVINKKPLPSETFLKAKIIGVMKFEDEGKTDDKIIVVPENDFGGDIKINEINDIPKSKIDEITHHFNHSENFNSQALTIVKGWGGKNEAIKIIYNAIKRWNNAKK